MRAACCLVPTSPAVDALTLSKARLAPMDLPPPPLLLRSTDADEAERDSSTELLPPIALLVPPRAWKASRNAASELWLASIWCRYRGPTKSSAAAATTAPRCPVDAETVAIAVPPLWSRLSCRNRRMEARLLADKDLRQEDRSSCCGDLGAAALPAF